MNVFFTSNKPPRFPERWVERLLWFVLLAGMALSAWQTMNLINPDSLGYMRAAFYYAIGRWDLAVNGYWGPMTSWLIVPFYKAGLDLEFAEQAVVLLSGAFFYATSRRLMRRLGLSKGELLAASMVLVLYIIGQTHTRSTDMLVAGWLALAAGLMLGPTYGRDVRVAMLSGICWGCAYLAKSIALPAGLAGILVFHLLLRYADGARGGVTIRWRSLAMVYLAFLAVSSVWIVVLSQKYDRVTFSTSGRIAHAISYPGVEEHESTYYRFHDPDPGRVTQWEEPSVLPYHYWSPFDSARDMRIQLGIINVNTRIMLYRLSEIDLFALCISSLLGVWLVSKPWTSLPLLYYRWQWGALICVIYLWPYLLTFAGPERYLDPSIPYFIAGTFGLAGWLVRQMPQHYSEKNRRWVLAAVVLSFVFSPALRVVFAIRPVSKERKENSLSLHLRKVLNDQKGPVAGGGSQGMSVAFYLNQSWHGEERSAPVEKFHEMATRVRWFLVPLNRRAELAADPLLVDRTDLLEPRATYWGYGLLESKAWSGPSTVLNHDHGSRP